MNHAHKKAPRSIKRGYSLSLAAKALEAQVACNPLIPNIKELHNRVVLT